MSGGWQRVTGPAASLLEDGIDTDVIFPARFLLRMDKRGLGECLFADRKAAGFALAPAAVILLGGAQFGCGSSREHAVWSLVDYGIRAVIAPSFGEIFANNAARNGLAVIALDGTQIDWLVRERADGELSVDLMAKTITTAGGHAIGFDMGEGDRQALINGWDEIDIIHAAYHGAIDGFENGYHARRPWLLRPQAAIV